jgi:hypothetical protein
MIRAGHISHMREKRKYAGFWYEKPKERNYVED